MPENKLQHFVPRCYLKAFTVDGKGCAIHIHNIKGRFSKQDTPVKGQCARPYFYGSDRLLEKALQDPEGRYAKFLRIMTQDPNMLNAKDLTELRSFVLLQMFRGAAYMERDIARYEAYRKFIDAGRASHEKLTPDRSHQETINNAIGMYIECQPTIGDLETCILINNTDLSFFTSDDPVVQTNKLHIQKRRPGGHGFSSAGMTLTMPISPKLMIIIFDPNVYYILGKSGHSAVISNKKDVEAFNQFQIMSARANLYFRDWSEESYVSSMLAEHHGLRKDRWFELNIMRETETGSRQYRRISEDSSYEGGKYIIHMAQSLPIPSRWPSILANRLRPKIVKSDSATGWTRPVQRAHPASRSTRSERVVMRPSPQGGG